MSLSVCLVTRNEESNVERVLRSVSGVADELIVVDTGSSDGTVARASELGAKVTVHAWRDDFAAARNDALSLAPSDWILWLNPDEELLPAAHAKLKQALANDDAFAFKLRVLDWLGPDRPDHVAETNQLRLFRRDAEIRYRGRLHPSFAPPLEELARRHGKLVCLADDIVIRRHAYLSVLTPEKLRWAARLLELELRDRPGQIHYMIEYGRTLLQLNDPRGHQILADAVEQLLPFCNAATPPTPTVGSLLEYLLTVSPEQSKSRLSKTEAQRLALLWFRQTPPVLATLAQCLFQAGDFAASAVLLEELLRMGRTGNYDRAAPFDPDVMGDATLMNLGICYVRTWKLDKAQECFEQLLAHPVHQAKARQNLTMVQKLRG